MRPWIATFLLLLFANLALPFSTLGPAFARVQISLATEEDDGATQGCRVKGKSKTPAQMMEEEYHHDDLKPFVVTERKSDGAWLPHLAERLPAPFSGEIATPPPNVC